MVEIYIRSMRESLLRRKSTHMSCIIVELPTKARENMKMKRSKRSTV
jgi:hypothetical protein